ncbi:MAG: FecR domain-containing protein [Saprospiraceae bacterium]|nr:FecR domain-containing protein [Saprospiraceae bacterium]
MSQDYTKYDAVELAGDAWFIQWIVEGDPEASQFWQDWLKAHPDRQSLVDEARLLVKALRFKETPAEENTVQRLWQNIDTLTEEPPVTSKQSRPGIIRWLGYAAAAASVALVLFFAFGRGETTVVAEYAEQRTLFLPDSSEVKLNAGTTISFDEKKWDTERVVNLDGEAFFEVKKGQTFSVQTNRGTVEVLGTSFNVNTHDGRFDVACYTGRVQVDSRLKDEQPAILNPGQRVRLNRDRQEMQADTFDLQRESWVSGSIEFDSTALSDVFAEMERQFDVEIEVNEALLVGKTHTGFLVQGNLDSTLTAVSWPNQLTYKKETPRRIIIEQQ